MEDIAFESAMKVTEIIKSELADTNKEVEIMR
jgi:hypothetical protein